MSHDDRRVKRSERYHPERYRLSRPFAKQAATLYQSAEGTSGLPTMKTLESMTDLIFSSYNREIENLPFEQRPENNSNVMRECSWAIHYAAFCATGRQIFHFNPEITEQFRKTDVDEVPIGSLKFPYRVFYMSFGKQPDLNLYSDGRFVDGAYINVILNEHLQAVLTTVGPGALFQANRFDWILKPERYYSLALPLADSSKGVSAAADEMLQKDLAGKLKPLEGHVPVMTFNGVTAIDRYPQSVKKEVADLQVGFPTFKEALRLIINGLCYLSAYRDDVTVGWPEDTPPSMLDKIRRAAKPKEVARTISKLVSMGYTKIHYCGREFERKKTLNVPTGREINTHWRRGHWRNQPFGPGLSERKLVWIMPVLVRKDKEGQLEPAGHIYLVE